MRTVLLCYSPHSGTLLTRTILCESLPDKRLKAIRNMSMRSLLRLCPGTAEEGGEQAAAVAAVAWDAPGERLALAYRAKGSKNEPEAVRIVVFATQQKPILSMRLLGLAQEPQSAAAGTQPATAHLHTCSTEQLMTLYVVEVYQSVLGLLSMREHPMHAGGTDGQKSSAEPNGHKQTGHSPEPAVALSFHEGSMLAVRKDRHRVSLYDCSRGWI